MSYDSSSQRRYSTREDDLRPPLRGNDYYNNSYREVRESQYLIVPAGGHRRANSTSRTIPVYEIDVAPPRQSSGSLSNSYYERRSSTLDVPSRTTTNRTRSPSPGPGTRSKSRQLTPPQSPPSSNTTSLSRKVTGFRYKPLNPGNEKSIRVLHVHPDLSRDGHVCCDLSHSSISAEYSALSYTWSSTPSASSRDKNSKSSGEDEATKTIILNDKPFPVRSNLHSFLKSYARRSLADRPLWVDAICINQEDVEEKNRQVGMMWKIYSFTKEVLVWLGPEESKGGYAGHAIKRMKEYADMGDIEVAMETARDGDFWKGFRDVNSAFYWDRVWVIQEFTLPSRGRIIQGRNSISFNDFQKTTRRFNNKLYRMTFTNVIFGSQRRSDFNDYISNIHPLWQRRLSYREDRPSSPSHDTHDKQDADWTTLSGVRHCKDLRDRVYGIMALSTHGSTLRVDYTLNPLELLLESIWLEHDSDIDRTDIVMNLANILLLTPAAICMYAQKVTHNANYMLHKCELTRRSAACLADLQQAHLEAAQSSRKKRTYLDKSTSDKKEVYWRNFASLKDRGSLKVPKDWPLFPGRDQCPWQMFVYTVAKEGKFGLKLAVDIEKRDFPDKDRDKDKRRSRSTRRDRDRSKDRDKSRKRDKSRSRKKRRPSSDDDSDEDRQPYISPTQFLSQTGTTATALGVYKTTCAPVAMTVYYALAEGLEGVGPADNRAGAVEEILEHIEF